MANDSRDDRGDGNRGPRNIFSFNLSDRVLASILAAAIGIGSTTAIVRTDPGKVVDRFTGEEGDRLERRIRELENNQHRTSSFVASLEKQVARLQRQIDRLRDRVDRR